MSLLIKLGIRNIGRNWLRSILTISAVVFCAGGLTGYSVLFSGIMDMMFEGLTSQTGHVRIIHEALIKKGRLAKGRYFINDIDALIKKTKKIKGVKAVLPRVELGAFMDNDGKQAPAIGIGMLPDAENKARDFNKKLLKGRLFKTDGKEIVLGYRLAKRLRAKLGSSIVLLGKTVDDSISATRLKVVGILGTGIITHDKMFYVSLKTAQDFRDTPKQASSILVFADAIWQSHTIKKNLAKLKLPKGATLQAWDETPWASQVIPMMNIMLFIFGGLMVFIGSIGLLNTMMMSVLERRNEIGVMMALGLSPFKIASVFLIEGVIFGFIGAILGVAIACLASIPLVIHGVTFGTEAVAKIPFPMSMTLKGAYTFEGIAIGLAVGILTTVVGSLWPAFQASRMEPVDALRK